jgi:hypothetical protein
MSAWVIGIDPGISGAIALLDDQGNVVNLMRPPLVQIQKGKTLRNQFNLPLLSRMIQSMKVAATEAGKRLVVYIEQVHAMPTDGGIQAFTFGRSFGQMEGIIAAYDLPCTGVHSSEWKAYMVAKQVSAPKVSKDDSAKITKKMRDRMRRQVTKFRKIASVEAAIRLFPGQAERFSGQHGDGAAEALLLAEWGRRRETSSAMTKPKQEKVVIDVPDLKALLDDAAPEVDVEETAE